MRTVVSIQPDTHKALCSFALQRGMKKTAVADLAVMEYIRRFSRGARFPLAQMETAGRGSSKKRRG